MSGRPLTIGSLFSGIGGLELGLERGIGEGCRTVWQVEQDEYCRAVLAKHWPNAKRYEDVRNVGAHNLAPVDLVCGGFPCQDISEAGKRVGIAGQRSGLWSEYLRTVRELRPRYVLVENVRALLRRGIDIVLGGLAECGYDAEWGVLGADDIGATQHRKRIWILANAHDARLQGPVWIGESPTPRQEWPAPCGEPLRSACGFWPPGPGAVADIPRMADGPTDRTHRLRALGNAVVPQVAEVVGRLIAEREKELRLTA